MQISPWILGAVIAVPLAGAVAGNAMSTDPIGISADVTETLPSAQFAHASGTRDLTQERLPDHYAMETPEGRVEVADLGLRGRYRDRARYDAHDPYAGDYDIDAEIARMEARWSVEGSMNRSAAALDAQQPQLARTAPEPRYAEAPHHANMAEARTGEIADGVIDIAATSEIEAEPSPYGRTIDVGAALAMRD